ncbi:hypothetical protein TELCIR_10408 [Teladorsagia circumcincta]|uniref:Uncharacterized protein n=1 Tax=Teladorsagia circumcincta TaxID=45464 RepID=A0A2G9UDL8_TELCI|nr:hypothetical protein TELCIR_10408 [Teladorsagia circumcincta]
MMKDLIGFPKIRFLMKLKQRQQITPNVVDPGYSVNLWDLNTTINMQNRTLNVDPTDRIRIEELEMALAGKRHDSQWIEGGRLEARLTGFRGGEGILELAQRKGQNPKLLAIMTGLQENRNFHLIYAPEVELSSCYKAGLMKDQGKKLITVDSDNRGMAIQPWTEIDFHILDDAVIDKVILVIEAGTSNVVDCGKLQIHGNVSDWQRAMNGSPTTLRVAVTYFVAVLVALLIFA